MEGKLCLLPVSRRRSEEERTRSRRGGDVGGGAGFEECRGERSLAREREREKGKAKQRRKSCGEGKERRVAFLPPSLSLPLSQGGGAPVSIPPFPLSQSREEGPKGSTCYSRVKGDRRRGGESSSKFDLR